MGINSNSNNSGGGGISFFGVLQIVFIVLKLLHKIDWSWGWVLSPIWIPFLIGVILGCIYRFWSRNH